MRASDGVSVGEASAGNWDARAEAYDGIYDGRSADSYALRSRMRAVLELLGEGPGDVLDAGMGAGRLCRELESRGWTAFGVDQSIAMVELARTRQPASSDNLVQGSIEALPFSDGTFDAVCATGVLEYTHVPTALAELARVLRPGGTAVVSYPNQAALYSNWKVWVYYPLLRAARSVLRRPDPLARRAGMVIDLNEFRGMLDRAGLSVEMWRHTSFLPIVAPFDKLLPLPAARLGERAERRFPRSAPLLATQFVFRARARGA